MKNSTPTTIYDCGDGRHLTGFAWQLHCASQLYFKFDEWSLSAKEWFGDAVAYQLDTLVNIAQNGTKEEVKDATRWLALYRQFINTQNSKLCQE